MISPTHTPRNMVAITCPECQQIHCSASHSNRRCSSKRSHRMMTSSRCRAQNNNTNRNTMIISRNSSILFLGLLTCAAVIVQALASTSSSSNNLAPWGTRGGALGSKQKPKTGLPSSSSSSKKSSPSSALSMLSGDETEEEKQKDIEKINVDIPSPLIRPLNGMLAADSSDDEIETTTVHTSTATAHHNSIHPGKSKKTILTPGGFADAIIPATYVAETNLPTDVGHFRIRAYRIEEFEDRVKNNPLGAGAGLGSEPCVIYCTDKPPFGAKGGERGGAKDVPVRIHDQCFTSEVFRSQRCDCKEQLKMSLEYIRENGGAIIYLQQEGRGIGLANKVAAYALQDVGLDTVDANTHLGFPEDARQYGVVPSLLEDIGIDSIKLMTNNPRKIERLTALGVDVTGTIPMVVPEANPYNRKYLETKKERMNHSNFGAMLSSSPGSILSSDYTHVDFTLSQQQKSVAEKYITDGEEMAAAAVQSALMDDPNQSGVQAAEDGYCFGRQSVEDAIAAVARGELIVVVDDESRENEGDFIMAADLCTPKAMAEFIRYSSGVICIGMEGKRMDELELPPMVVNNEDPKETAFSVSVDARSEHGITTGISATDRAKTSVFLAKPDAKASDFHRPGHIFPLRAKDNGVLTRDGHTEAAVDFARLAGSSPAGLLCEIVSEENPTEMARLPELKRFCKNHGYVLTSIADLQQYRRDTGL